MFLRVAVPFLLRCDLVCFVHVLSGQTAWAAHWAWIYAWLPRGFVWWRALGGGALSIRSSIVVIFIRFETKKYPIRYKI